jgi:hypothetical protein
MPGGMEDQRTAVYNDLPAATIAIMKEFIWL